MQIITTGSHETPACGVTATVGVFDGVHRGHLHLLRQLREVSARHGTAAAVVTFANHPLEVVDPGRAPSMLTSTAERLRLLERGGVDVCVLMDFSRDIMEMSPSAFLDYVGGVVDLRGIVAGYNNRLGRAGSETLEEACGNRKLPFYRAEGLYLDGGKVSSSVIRNLLANGEMGKVTEMLGRYYRMAGTVGHGREIGRTLGFPTANLVPVFKHKQLPACGVYACMAEVEDFPGQRFKSIVNVGTNPTIADDNRLTVEVHVMGLRPETELYDKELAVEFVTRLRDEKRFDSREALRAQLEADREKASALLNLCD